MLLHTKNCGKVWLTFLIGGMLGTSLQAQDEITAISFDTVPPGIGVVADPITLEGDVDVTGGVTIAGGGLQFPDGTVQTSATAAGISANSGLYNNRIVDATFTNAFTEICIKSGAVQSDIHSASDSTAGGNCLPGDLGWIIEREERMVSLWENARMECLLEGMRLPEVFEFLYACKRDTLFGLSDMTDDPEWSGNSVSPMLFQNGVITHSVLVAGNATCSHGNVAFAGRSDGNSPESTTFRCVR